MIKNIKMIEGLTYAEYEALPGLRISQLLAGRRSAAALKYELDHGEDSATKPKSLGSALHAKVLTPDEYDSEFVVWTGGNKTKARKAWNDFKAEHADKTIIDTADQAAVEAMAKSISVDRDCFFALSGTKKEIVVTWDEGKTPCKARIDYLSHEDRRFGCIKTTADPTPFGFGRVAARFHYVTKLGWYARPLRELFGQMPEVSLIVVASTLPYEATRWMLDDYQIEWGINDAEELITMYKDCRARHDWPGIPGGILRLPAWMGCDCDEEVEFDE